MWAIRAVEAARVMLLLSCDIDTSTARGLESATYPRSGQFSQVRTRGALVADRHRACRPSERGFRTRGSTRSRLSKRSIPVLLAGAGWVACNRRPRFSRRVLPRHGATGTAFANVLQHYSLETHRTEAVGVVGTSSVAEAVDGDSRRGGRHDVAFFRRLGRCNRSPPSSFGVRPPHCQ